MSYSSCGEAEGGSVASCWSLGVAGTTLRICGGVEGDAACGVACGGGIDTDPADAIVDGGTARCGGGESVFASVDKSSGAPALRPPGAPIGPPPGSGAAITASFPRVRGAPGRLGFCVGSKTSERRPGCGAIGAFPWFDGATCGGDAAPPRDPICWKRYSVSSCMRLSCDSSC